MPAVRAVYMHHHFLDQSPTKKSNLEEKVVEMDLLTTWREIHRLYSQPFFCQTRSLRKYLAKLAT